MFDTSRGHLWQRGRLRGALQHSEDQVVSLQRDAQDVAALRQQDTEIVKNRLWSLCLSRLGQS